jgi:FtsP/CotA-like multicopper oxidase with cupredoxin domain
MFILDDDTSTGLGLPNRYGIDDIPLIVQDKQFTRSGTLDEANDGDFGILGDHILVNGVHKPSLQVTTTRVRLRVLNASNARTYQPRIPRPADVPRHRHRHGSAARSGGHRPGTGQPR